MKSPRETVAMTPRSRREDEEKSFQSTNSGVRSGSGGGATHKSPRSTKSGMSKPSSAGGSSSGTNSSRPPRNSNSSSDLAVMSMASRNRSGNTGSSGSGGTGDSSNSSPSQPVSPRTRMRKSRLQLEASKRSIAMRRFPSSPSTASAYAKSGKTKSDRNDGGQAAADALRNDLEEMGYNLNCESFITRNSSTTTSECDERYAGPKIMAAGSAAPSYFEEESSGSESEDGSETLSQIAYLLDSSSSEEEVELSCESSEEDESAIEVFQPKRNIFGLFGQRKNKHGHFTKSVDSRESPSLTESNTTEDTQDDIRGRNGTRAAQRKKAVVKKKQLRIKQRPTVDSASTDPVKVVSIGINTSFKSPNSRRESANDGKSSTKDVKEKISASCTLEETASGEAATNNEASVAKLSPKDSKSKARSIASSMGRTNTPSKILSSPAHEAQAQVFKRTATEAVASNDDEGSWNAGEPHKKKQTRGAAGEEANEEDEATDPAVTQDDSKTDNPTATKASAWEWPTLSKTADPRKIKANPSDDQSPQKITSVPSGQGFSLASLSTDEGGVEKVFIDGMSVVYEVGVQSVSPDYIIDGNAADDERENAKHGDARLPSHQQVPGTRLENPMQGHPIARKKSVRIKSPDSVEHLRTVKEEEPTREFGDIEPWLEIDKISGKPILRGRGPSSPVKPKAFQDRADMADKAPVVYVGPASPQQHDLDPSPRESPRHMSRSRHRHRPTRKNISLSWNKSPHKAAKTPEDKKGRLGSLIGTEDKKGRLGSLIGNLFKKGTPPVLAEHRHGGMVAIRLIEEAEGIDLTLLPAKSDRRDASTKGQMELKPEPAVLTPDVQQQRSKNVQIPHVSPAPTRSSFRSRSEGQSEATDEVATSTQMSDFDLTYEALKKYSKSQMDCSRVPNLAEAMNAFNCESGYTKLTAGLLAPPNKRAITKSMTKTKSAYTRSAAALATSLCPDPFLQSNDLTTQILYKTSDDRSFNGSLNLNAPVVSQPRRKLRVGVGSPKAVGWEKNPTEKNPTSQNLEGAEINSSSPAGRPIPSNAEHSIKEKRVVTAVSSRKPQQATGTGASPHHARTLKNEVGGGGAARKALSVDDSEITMDTITKLFAAGSDISHDNKGGEQNDTKTKPSGENEIGIMQELSKRGLIALFSKGAEPQRTASAPAVIHNKTTKQINNVHHESLPPRPANRKNSVEQQKETSIATSIAKPPTRLPSSLRQPRHSVPRNTTSTPKTAATAPPTVKVEHKKAVRPTFGSPTGHIFKRQASKPKEADVLANKDTARSDVAMAYPIEFNDDNCTLNMNPSAVATASPPHRALSTETIDNAAQLQMRMSSTANRSSISPVVERARSEKRSGSPEDVMADLLSSPKPTLHAPHSHRRLITPQSPLADLISEESWVEVNEAASLLSRAMSVIDSVKSEDTVNDAQHLHKLLSEERDLSGVEDALHTLKKHADRMGLRESDLLIAAVRSEETGGSVLSATTGQISTRSMTIGEELTEMFNFFLGRSSTTKSNRKARSFMLP